MKRDNKGLMSVKQYRHISSKLSEVAPCSLLVFGLGEDSYLWRNINEKGTTIFLEDDEEWINQVNDGSLDVEKIVYKTRVEDAEIIGFDAEKLALELPEKVTNRLFDFIIVDAPLGHQPPRPFKGPGRMSSIFAASTLLSKKGIAVVDDMARNVEKTYAFHFLGKENLSEMIEGKVGVFDFRSK